MELNNLLVNGEFYPKLKVGQTKREIEELLGLELGSPDIETDDVDYYMARIKTGICLVIIFDKSDVCFEIRLDLDKNEDIGFVIKSDDGVLVIDNKISFETLIAILFQLNIEWVFDKKRIYLQTACVSLGSGLSLYYAFGEKSDNDHGFVSIKSVLEGHHLVI